MLAYPDFTHRSRITLSILILTGTVEDLLASARQNVEKLPETAETVSETNSKPEIAKPRTIGRSTQQIISRPGQYEIQTRRSMEQSASIEAADSIEGQAQEQPDPVPSTPLNDDSTSQRCAETIKTLQDKLHASRPRSPTVQRQSASRAQTPDDQHDLNKPALAMSENGDLKTAIRGHI